MPPEYIRVGFGMRLLAWILDEIFIFIVAGAATLLIFKAGIHIPIPHDDSASTLQSLYRWLGVSADDAAWYAKIVATYTFILLIISFAYSLISAFFGASPAKMLLGLTIANADGKRGSMKLWFRRWAVRDANVYLQALALLPTLAFLDFVGAAIGIIVTIGCFMALGDSRMALHDRIAQSAVFRRSDVQ